MRALKLLATIAITVVIQACSTSKAVVSTILIYRNTPMWYLVKRLREIENWTTL